MRTFAWICVAVGLAIAVLGPVGVKLEYESRRTEDNLQRQALGMWSSLSEPPLARTWTLVGVGAGTSAYGVLLLAIRPPSLKPKEPNK